MELNFEIPLHLVYEMQKKLETREEIIRYSSTYCKTQVESKKELIRGLNSCLSNQPYRFFVIGPWYGTLIVPYLLNNFNVEHLTLIDIDKSVRRLLKSYTRSQCDNFTVDDYNVFETTNWLDQITSNTVIINTSCEHMPNMMQLDAKAVYALQSNNYYDHPEHVNCVNDLEEFALKSGLNHLTYSSQITFDKYTRFTIIGSR